MRSLKLIHLAFCVSLCSCATYADTMRDADRNIARGNTDRALKKINDALDVKTASSLPENFKKNRSLLLLERATVLQGLREYKLSARDFIYADQYISWLDVTNETVDSLVKYLYSAHASRYRAPSYERAMLNILNMVNFLAMRDFQGAKVEARRFDLLASFITSENSAYKREILTLGHTVAGIAFEGARDYAKALRHYEDAWNQGSRTPLVKQRIIGLMRLVGSKSRAKDVLSDVRSEAKRLGRLDAESFRKEYGSTVFVITQMGLVPRKEAQYIPIITARRYSNYHGQITGINGINFPVLQASFAGTSRAKIRVDDTARAVVTDFDVAQAVRDGWMEIVPQMMTAAIVRAVTRAAVGATTRAATSGKKSEGWGALLALVLTGALTAQDRPDTRSWTTLPAHFSIVGYQLAPGQHSVAVTVNGRTETQPVTIEPGKIHVLNFSKNR